MTREWKLRALRWLAWYAVAFAVLEFVRYGRVVSLMGFAMAAYTVWACTTELERETG